MVVVSGIIIIMATACSGGQSGGAETIMAGSSATATVRRPFVESGVEFEVRPVAGCGKDSTYVAEVAWSSPASGSVRITVGGYAQRLFLDGEASGAARTGLWVQAGLPFDLYDSAGIWLARALAPAGDCSTEASGPGG